MYGRDIVAPPGNQVATEKTNIDLQHRESPVYSTKTHAAFLRNVALIPEGLIQQAFNKIWARIAEMNEPDSSQGRLLCLRQVSSKKPYPLPLFGRGSGRWFGINFGIYLRRSGFFGQCSLRSGLATHILPSLRERDECYPLAKKCVPP